jgi:uncharacterized protein (TIGR03437 family)
MRKHILQENILFGRHPVKTAIHILKWGTLAGLLAAPLLAQNISVVSGNGQLVAPSCYINGEVLAENFTVFEPMTVLVTNSSGSPMAGATVTWQVTSGTGVFSTSSTPTETTTTGANGMASATFTATGVASVAYLQNTIAALTSTSSATFYLTQAAVTNYVACTFSVQTTVTSPAAGTTISGDAGGTGSPAITANVASSGTGIPNVSVRLINTQDSAGVSLTPAASCATGAGADTGSVLTDINGNATCTPTLQSSAGSGSVSVLYGGVGVASANNGSQFQGGPIGYSLSSSFPVQVTAAAAGAITISSGNNQSANPGQALPQALTAEVMAVGGGAVAGQAVTWSVTPSGSATLSNTTTTSNANGTVSTNVTLASTAAGTIDVTVALASNPSIAATFTETASVPVTGLQIVSGNNQSAAISTAFSQPLIVQVNGTNSQPLSNVGVQFSLSGPGTLSASSATTNANGQAQVTVTAGATTGAITVTASVSGQSASFSLTVTPSAPALTSANFFNGAGFYPTDSSHSALTPCGLSSIIGPGLAPGIQGVVAPQDFGVLPYQVANVTITVGGAQAPIYSVSNVSGQQPQVNFQVPCSLTVAEGGSTFPVVVTVNGSATTISVTVRSTGPGIFQATMSNGTTQAIIIRPDGSFMDPVTNPVRPGEQVVMYVTGIGPTSPPVGTNAVPAPGLTATAVSQIFVGVNNQGVPLISAVLSPDLVGVSEVTFTVPANTPSGTYNLSMGINAPDGTATQFSENSEITVAQ